MSATLTEQPCRRMERGRCAAHIQGAASISGLPLSAAYDVGYWHIANINSCRFSGRFGGIADIASCRWFLQPRHDGTLQSFDVSLYTRGRQTLVFLEIYEMANGTVKWFNPTKGYGFIQPQGGGKDVFVHISAVERAGLSTLNEGQAIEYEEVANRGKTSAENLKVQR